jgi:hypothetical protein
VKTDLAVAIPWGTYARIGNSGVEIRCIGWIGNHLFVSFVVFGFAAPRSGLAAKHFIDTGAGVVDYDYRGNVGVVLFNHAETDFQSKEQRIWLQGSCVG